jgi:hypothetical protein
MRTPDIEAQIRQQPFVPFLMHMSDGSHFEIRHPEMMLISERVLGVAVYDRPGAQRATRIVMCDPIHVTRLEPINGQLTDKRR